MRKQTSLAHFFKQPGEISLLSNSSSAISNDPDLDVIGKKTKPSLKRVTLTTTMINYTEYYV